MKYKNNAKPLTLNTPNFKKENLALVAIRKKFTNFVLCIK